MPASKPSASLFHDDDHAPPAAVWITAHCDGGARGNPGPAGYGAILHDQSGRVLAELSEFLGVRTNNYAEYAGLLACLQWALDNGHKHLRVISDSLLMVNQIQGRYKINSPDLRPLWEEARRRIARLDRFDISHALRHKNKDADRLANQAMDRGTGRDTERSVERGLAEVPTQANTRATTHPTSRTSGRSPDLGTALPPQPGTALPQSPPPGMLRGFTRDGVVHLLGGARLPDGVFVKVIPE